jgi:hypothetical protein
MTNSDLPHGKQDPYSGVPHQGKHFLENGKLCYWNFNETAKVGDMIKRTDRAWRSLGKPTITPAGEPCALPGLGGSPVQGFVLHNPGFYFEIDKHVECVDTRDTPDGRIVQWVNHCPLSGVDQQCIAWNTSSVDEYESLKAQALEQRQNT